VKLEDEIQIRSELPRDDKLDHVLCDRTRVPTEPGTIWVDSEESDRGVTDTELALPMESVLDLETSTIFDETQYPGSDSKNPTGESQPLNSKVLTVLDKIGLTDRPTGPGFPGVKRVDVICNVLNEGRVRFLDGLQNCKNEFELLLAPRGPDYSFHRLVLLDVWYALQLPKKGEMTVWSLLEPDERLELTERIERVISSGISPSGNKGNRQLYEFVLAALQHVELKEETACASIVGKGEMPAKLERSRIRNWMSSRRRDLKFLFNRDAFDQEFVRPNYTRLFEGSSGETFRQKLRSGKLPTAISPHRCYLASLTRSVEFGVCRRAVGNMAGLLGELGAPTDDLRIPNGFMIPPFFGHVWIEVRFGDNGKWRSFDPSPDPIGLPPAFNRALCPFLFQRHRRFLEPFWTLEK